MVFNFVKERLTMWYFQSRDSNNDKNTVSPSGGLPDIGSKCLQLGGGLQGGEGKNLTDICAAILVRPHLGL